MCECFLFAHRPFLMLVNLNITKQSWHNKPPSHRKLVFDCSPNMFALLAVAIFLDIWTLHACFLCFKILWSKKSERSLVLVISCVNLFLADSGLFNSMTAVNNKTIQYNKNITWLFPLLIVLNLYCIVMLYNKVSKKWGVVGEHLSATSHLCIVWWGLLAGWMLQKNVIATVLVCNKTCMHLLQHCGLLWLVPLVVFRPSILS